MAGGGRAPRLVVAAILVILVAGLGMAPSGATTIPPSPPPTPPPEDCFSNCRDGGGAIDGNDLVAEADYTDPGGSGGGPGPTGESRFADCYWQEAEPGVSYYLHPIAAAWEKTFDEPTWLIWCAPSVIVYAYFPIGDPPPQWMIDDLVADAYDRTPVTFFNPRTSPDGDENIPLLVQALTYLWVDQDLWERRPQATATIPGIMSVTTTAEAYLATWSGGDEPQTIDCAGPGEPYRFGIGGDDAQDQSCTFVIKRDSTVEPDRRIQVTVHWRVSYTCSAFCAGGPLPDITTTSARPVLVTEIQAVNVRSTGD